MNKTMLGAATVLLVCAALTGCTSHGKATAAPTDATTTTAPISTPSAPSTSAASTAYVTKVDALGGRFTSVTAQNAPGIAKSMCSLLQKKDGQSFVTVIDGQMQVAFQSSVADAKTFVADTVSAFCPAQMSELGTAS